MCCVEEGGHSTAAPQPLLGWLTALSGKDRSILATNPTCVATCILSWLEQTVLRSRVSTIRLAKETTLVFESLLWCVHIVLPQVWLVQSLTSWDSTNTLLKLIHKVENVVTFSVIPCQLATTTRTPDRVCWTNWTSLWAAQIAQITLNHLS